VQEWLEHHAASELLVVNNRGPNRSLAATGCRWSTFSSWEIATMSDTRPTAAANKGQAGTGCIARCYIGATTIPNHSLRASQDSSGADTCGYTSGPGDEVHGGEYGDRTSKGGGGTPVAKSNAKACPNERLHAQE
jgi:hypothetical protein